MKSVLITFDQAYYERIMALLDRLGVSWLLHISKSAGAWFENRRSAFRKPCLAKYVLGYPDSGRR